jgi:NADPH:quinone reductase-like Zn-dependent oxidoreductase
VRRLDIAVDSVGGPASATLGHHLRFGGTLVTYAAQSGQSPVLSQADLIGKQANPTGFWLYNWWQRAPLARAAVHPSGQLISAPHQSKETHHVPSATP